MSPGSGSESSWHQHSAPGGCQDTLVNWWRREPREPRAQARCEETRQPERTFSTVQPLPPPGPGPRCPIPPQGDSQALGRLEAQAPQPTRSPELLPQGPSLMGPCPCWERGGGCRGDLSLQTDTCVQAGGDIRPFILQEESGALAFESNAPRGITQGNFPVAGFFTRHLSSTTSVQHAA